MKELADQLNRRAAEFRAAKGENSEHHAKTMEAIANLISLRGLPASVAVTVMAPPGTNLEPPADRHLTASESARCESGRPARFVYDHKVNGLNDAITIRPLGEPGAGGAHTRYLLELAGPTGDLVAPPIKTLDIQFQSRPIKGPNDFDGWTNEALIAVVIDRMRGFQGIGVGSIQVFPCRENAIALTDLENALHWLQARTRDRMRRGVEGRHAQ